MNKLQSMLNGKKVSVIFNEYASPVLEFYMEEAGYTSLDEMSIEEMNQVLQLPWLIWNAVVAKGKNLVDFLGGITMLTTRTPEEINELIKFMRKRKETKFNKYKFYLGEFKLHHNILNDQIMLTVEARMKS